MVESTAKAKSVSQIVGGRKSVEEKVETQKDADAKHPGKENENKKPREPTDAELK